MINSDYRFIDFSKADIEHENEISGAEYTY